MCTEILSETSKLVSPIMKLHVTTITLIIKKLWYI